MIIVAACGPFHLPVTYASNNGTGHWLDPLYRESNEYEQKHNYENIRVQKIESQSSSPPLQHLETAWYKYNSEAQDRTTPVNITDSWFQLGPWMYLVEAELDLWLQYSI